MLHQEYDVLWVISWLVSEPILPHDFGWFRRFFFFFGRTFCLATLPHSLPRHVKNTRACCHRQGVTSAWQSLGMPADKFLSCPFIYFGETPCSCCFVAHLMFWKWFFDTFWQWDAVHALQALWELQQSDETKMLFRKPWSNGWFLFRVDQNNLIDNRLQIITFERNRLILSHDAL